MIYTRAQESNLREFNPNRFLNRALSLYNLQINGRFLKSVFNCVLFISIELAIFIVSSVIKFERHYHDIIDTRLPQRLRAGTDNQCDEGGGLWYDDSTGDCILDLVYTYI